MDFLVVPTVGFKLLFVLVILRHQRRRLISLRADSGSLDSGIRSYLGQASEHDTDHGEADEGNGGGGVSLEVASEPAIASDPGKGALDDPSLGQDDELVGFTPFDDFKLLSTGIGNDLCDPWPLIGGISEELGD
jgi:hypothetical protein